MLHIRKRPGGQEQTQRLPLGFDGRLKITDLLLETMLRLSTVQLLCCGHVVNGRKKQTKARRDPLSAVAKTYSQARQNIGAFLPHWWWKAALGGPRTGRCSHTCGRVLLVTRPLRRLLLNFGVTHECCFVVSKRTPLCCLLTCFLTNQLTKPWQSTWLCPKSLPWRKERCSRISEAFSL